MRANRFADDDDDSDMEKSQGTSDGRWYGTIIFLCHTTEQTSAIARSLARDY